ncbi:M20 family metallopeptidase [Verticiella sediminum]|nr:M20 family metallopeptidase [Verticiella sediminum]
MMRVDDLKARAAAAIDEVAPRLYEVSEAMHAHVERPFEEVKGQAWLCEVLSEAGFQVEKGLGSLSTAFRGTVRSSGPGPRIAFLCEYDGLPPYGHSCGHNVGGPASIGAAVGLKSVMDMLGGEVIALGTPGEEGGNGKHIMQREGFFDGLDAMMLIYPGRDNIAHSRALVATRVNFSYFGRAAHGAARPEWGINALDAMTLAFNGIGLLRQQTPSDVRMHYIVTKGGTLSNVIPDHTSGVLTVRANDNATIDMMIPRINGVLEGAASMTGATLEKTWAEGPRGKPLLSNDAMAQLFDRNLQALGRATRARDELSGAWSGDTSNVSWAVPTIQPQIAMTAHPPHSHEFHEASVGPAARAALADSAKAMAMTAIDLMLDASALDAVKAEFMARTR